MRKIDARVPSAKQRLPVARRLALQKKLLRWFSQHQRDVPWRRTRDPYRIWISEVMLQQTQTAKVMPYYRHFLERFPTLQALAHATLSAVLKSWEGLGYYARARNVHRAARYLLQHRQGKLPRAYDELLQVPGIGPYTAAALVSIAFDRPHPVVDGNVERVLSRLFCVDMPAKDKTGRKVIARLAQNLLPAGKARWWNQAIMELGALICRPRRPRCPECPLQGYCLARKHFTDPAVLPVRLTPRARPHHHIVVGLVWKDGRLLIDRRWPHGLLGGLWEFPGGKVEPGESHACALRRELLEELAVEAEVGGHFMRLQHGYTHFTITLHVYHCHYVAGEPRPIRCQAWRWARPRDLRRYAFPAANRRIVDALLLSARL